MLGRKLQSRHTGTGFGQMRQFCRHAAARTNQSSTRSLSVDTGTCRANLAWSPVVVF